jgi:tRNA (guanine-N7-)-methyltransferase
VSRALKYDIPGPDWRVTPEFVSRAVSTGGWERIFEPDLKEPERLVLDLGFGRGEFLIGLANACPRSAFLGVEVSFKRVLKMARRLAVTGLDNVRLLEATAEIAVGDLLPKRSAKEIWVNFPDPWPKKRHHERRLLQPGFVADVRACLREGGVVHVATDHADYAESIDEVLGSASGLENIYAPKRYRGEVTGRTPTAYERTWRAEGRALFFFAYRWVA